MTVGEEISCCINPFVTTLQSKYTINVTNTSRPSPNARQEAAIRISYYYSGSVSVFDIAPQPLLLIHNNLFTISSITKHQPDHPLVY